MSLIIYCRDVDILNKKLLVIIITIVFLIISLSGCNDPSSIKNDTENNTEHKQNEKIVLSLNNISVDINEFEGDWELVGDIYVDEEYYNNDRTSLGYGWYFSERSEYRMESETQVAKYQLNLRISMVRDEEDYVRLTYNGLKQKAEESFNNLIDESNLTSLDNFNYSLNMPHEQIGDMSSLVSAGGQRSINGTPHYINMYILYYKIANVIIEINLNSLTIQMSKIQDGRDLVINGGHVVEVKLNNALVKSDL